jgi:hypothetical protein
VFKIHLDDKDLHIWLCEHIEYISNGLLFEHIQGDLERVTF